MVTRECITIKHWTILSHAHILMEVCYRAIVIFFVSHCRLLRIVLIVFCAICILQIGLKYIN